MTDCSTDARPAESGDVLVSSPVTMPLVLREVRSVAASAVVTCGERLPRDVLVRLAALSRQVGRIRQGQAPRSELALRLGDVAAGLDALTRSIYDETVLHFVGRRG